MLHVVTEQRLPGKTCKEMLRFKPFVLAELIQAEFSPESSTRWMTDPLGDLIYLYCCIQSKVYKGSGIFKLHIFLLLNNED